ncbi:MAG: flagellar hook-length control protein FliK [Lachnospiraceae bacterium]|nr:flagellar hook-length control protein FliK [Candidatus Colinaster equi]
MTANMVTGFGPIQDLIPGQAAGIGSTGGADFTDVLKNSTGKEQDVPKAGQNVEKKPAIEEENVETDSTQTPKETVEKEAKTDKPEGIDKSQKTEASNDDEISEETIETITAAIEAVIIDIAETFDVTVEDVEVAIDTLGLQDEEILNPNNIPLIAVEITDATDTMDIMTDEQLFANVKKLMSDVTETMDNLAKELDVTVSDVKSVLDKMMNEEVDVPVTANDIKITDEPKKQVTDFEIPEAENTAKVQVQEDVPVKNQDRRQSGNGEQNAHNFSQNVIQNLKENIELKSAEVPEAFTTSTEQIMEQVTENLKMTMNEDITQMEMQLHPASLGNVRVQVAARDGVITANFTTQNEDVKAALEAQIVQLKEQMNEQGIKVEAVEVTVNSHAFERNLNEEGGRNNSSDSEPKKRKVRGINLGDMNVDNIDEMVDDDDKVVADMMARNGNTVDYMA